MPHPKILIVDDREDNLLSMESILEPDGYRIVKANSGRQVLKILLTDFDFALILMDVQMPNLNGFETASLIYEREKLRHIPIIFITAHNLGEEHVFKAYRAGAVDYLYKPVNPDLLKAKVAVFVDLYKKNHRLLAQEQKLVAINKSLELEIHDRMASEETVRELNRQLLENITRLESANKDLDLFAFMASHDLQAPLRKIRMFSDRLMLNQQETLNKDGKLYLSRIQDVSRRMQDLINDILRFSRLSGERESFEAVDLNVVLKEVLSEIDVAIRDKAAEIILEDLPVIPASGVLLGPLFSNLLDNSLKYSRKGVVPVIRIRSEFSHPGDLLDKDDENGPHGVNALKEGREGEKRYCRIYIEDNGIGFEQKYAEQIFDMFRRLHPIAEYEGTGIGLALCKRIVEKHRGFISALGRPGEGSVFIVSLPVKSEKMEVMV
jgi:light-regulated signal transduction histidine kinase (bacteriophytochrome)